MTNTRTKRVVYKHYPAARLPDDLREGIPLDSLVTITIEWEEDEASSIAPEGPDSIPPAKKNDRD